MTTNTIKLSIVMPVFNRKNLVAIMLDSILANDFNDYEVLAVDDGSDEDTVALLNEYQNKDNRIKLIQRTELPKGATKCRNIGIDKAQGEYIIFFDSDDIITPSCLSTRVNAISKRTDVDFLVFPSCTYYKETLHPMDTKFVYGHKVHEDDLQFFCQRLLPFVVVNNIYRTASLRNHNIRWDEQLKSLQDCDFNVQTILAGLKYDYVETKPDYGYRIDERGAAVSSGIITKAHFESNLHSINKLYTMVQNVHGHSYDSFLYKGVLYAFNNIMTNGIEFSFANQLSSLVKSHNSLHGTLLAIRFGFCRVLSHFLSPRHSRQIPMSMFIIRRLRLEKKNEQKIAQLLQQNS